MADRFNTASRITGLLVFGFAGADVVREALQPGGHADIAFGIGLLAMSVSFFLEPLNLVWL